jgi:hypothetical protein
MAMAKQPAGSGTEPAACPERAEDASPQRDNGPHIRAQPG